MAQTGRVDLRNEDQAFPLEPHRIWLCGNGFAETMGVAAASVAVRA